MEFVQKDEKMCLKRDINLDTYKKYDCNAFYNGLFNPSPAVSNYNFLALNKIAVIPV